MSEHPENITTAVFLRLVGSCCLYYRVSFRMVSCSEGTPVIKQLESGISAREPAPV